MKKLSLVLAAGAAVALISAMPVAAANTLTVGAGSALGGTNFGLSINVDAGAGITNPVFVQSDHPTDETHLLLRFRLRVDGLLAPAAGAGRNFRLMNVVDDSAPATPHKIVFIQRQNTTGNWRLHAWTYTDGGIYEAVGGFFLANFGGALDRQVECEWTQATAGANGIFGCFRVDTPGTQFFQRTNIDDGNYQGDQVQVGFFDFDGFPGTAAASQLDFDEYESYR